MILGKTLEAKLTVKLVSSSHGNLKIDQGLITQPDYYFESTHTAE